MKDYSLSPSEDYMHKKTHSQNETLRNSDITKQTSTECVNLSSLSVGNHTFYVYHYTAFIHNMHAVNVNGIPIYSRHNDTIRENHTSNIGKYLLI